MGNWIRVAALFLAAGLLPGAGVHVGFELRELKYAGPGEWRLPVTPIWVHEYSLLRLKYRATGLDNAAGPVLTLRPGSVGPVTPGATNRENPFAMGAPVVAVTAGDLTADGQSRTFEVNLRPKLLTAQMDQLQWRLPAGAKLEIETLEFLAPGEVFSCAGGPALPASAERLHASAKLTCAGSPATSLRGRESILIDGGRRKGNTVYLSLTANFPVVTNFTPNQSVDRWRWRETSETSMLMAVIRYEAGQEEQFPLLVSELRHAVLNRKPALYALALDPGRALSAVELQDRSEHGQIVLHAAGLSQNKPPQAKTESVPPPAAATARPPAELVVSDAQWFRIDAAKGKAAPAAGILRPELNVASTSEGRLASLSIQNAGREPVEFVLVFPAMKTQPDVDPSDVYYVFPTQGAVISRAERSWEATYTARFPLQFLDVFAPSANRGAALIVRDLAAQLKVFRLKKTGPVVELETEYLVRLAPGETFRAPDALLAPHGGDWRQGFDIYRRWVESWYKPKSPRPAWLRDAWWCRRDYPVGGTDRLFDVRKNRYTFEELIREGEAFGGVDFIDISGWALSEAAGRVGDYPIELGGAEDLRGNIERASRLGIRTGLYFEGYLVDRNSKVGKQNLEKWQLIGADGKGAWWPGGSPEFFVCPALKDWQRYLAARAAEVAKAVHAHGVYLDEHGFGTRRCYSTNHGHPPGVGMIPYEIEMAQEVRRALDAAGMDQTMIYLEETPVDAAAAYYDAAFCYAIPHASAAHSPVKLNLWRFVFPDVRLWDMLTIGVQPRPLSLEDFRLSLWHGNGVWLKGRAETWYGEEVLAFMRQARAWLRGYAAAFNGKADPLVESPHPAVAVNRFRGGGRTVYTLFNVSYRTVQFAFQGTSIALGPRDVTVVEGRDVN